MKGEGRGGLARRTKGGGVLSAPVLCRAGPDTPGFTPGLGEILCGHFPGARCFSLFTRLLFQLHMSSIYSFIVFTKQSRERVHENE